MALTSQFPGRSGGQRKTLAHVLAAGPIPLHTALDCANDVAGVLREMHEQGRAHGSVTSAHVVMTGNCAELQPARSWVQPDAGRDIREFGALLFQMLTGALPRPGELPHPSRLPGSRSGRAGLRASALQVAGNCAGEGSFQPSMQQVLTELRLLAVLLKMAEKSESAHPPAPSVTATPFLVTPTFLPHQRPAAVLPLAPPPVAANTSTIDEETAPVVALGRDSFGHPSEQVKSDVEPKGGPCPKCNGSIVYVSRPRTTFEAYLVRMKVPICRCHSCYHRYIVFSGMKIVKDLPAETTPASRPHRRKP